MVVVIDDLAVQAIDAFVLVDIAVRMNRLDRAAMFAHVALDTALMTALEPVEHLVLGRDCQGRTKGAQVAAKEAVDEQAGPEKDHRIKHKRPSPSELEGNGRLERFDL